jgi:WD40 repeat protein
LTFLKDISDKAQKSYTIDSVISTFMAFDGNSYAVFATQTHSILVYDLSKEAVVNTLTGHSQHVYITRHFPCEKTRTDYLLSTSYERNVKVWNLNTASCALTISNCHNGFYLYSSIILFDTDGPFVITSAPNELTKVWNFKGVLVREICSNKDYTYYLNVWQDRVNSKTYLINANSVDVKMYDFKTGSLYKEFKPTSSTWHMAASVAEYKNLPHLFETDGNGYLRIWNIKNAQIALTIHVTGCSLRGFCIWNSQYVLAASSDKSVKVIDLNSNSVSSIPKSHNNVICSVEKIVHPLYGECLLSSAIDGFVKLWTFKK